MATMCSLTEECTPDLAQLVYLGLMQAGREHTTGWAMWFGGPTPGESIADYCRSLEVQDGLLSAWVAARKQEPCPGLVGAVVAAVTAARQVQPAVAEPVQQPQPQLQPQPQQQQQGVVAVAGDQAGVYQVPQQQQQQQQQHMEGGEGTAPADTSVQASPLQPRATRRSRRAQPVIPLACTLRSRK
jgi:hypothetical protein